MSCKTFPLSGYARLSSPGDVSSASENSSSWEYFYNGSAGNLEMTLTPSHQLLLHHGKTLLESMSLLSSSLRGFNKGDSLLLLQGLKTSCRRFRMKFSSDGGETGEERCKQCVLLLAQHFPIKRATSPTVKNTQTAVKEANVLHGEVTLSQVADAITKNSTPLPVAYHASNQSNCYPGDGDMATFIKLCLSDNTFPAFVEQVETELEKIKSECSYMAHSFIHSFI